jgi:hypothetical protein
MSYGGILIVSCACSLRSYGYCASVKSTGRQDVSPTRIPKRVKRETAAILVGEPIGEKPNSFQEAREMRLPNSHVIARYSTESYSFVEKGENVIQPDQEIDREWNSYQAGLDPVLEWALEYKIP